MTQTDGGQSTIRVDVAGPITTITLDRPDRRNALNALMEAELIEALSLIGGDPDCRALILTGAGSSFCSGGDFGSADEDGFPKTPLAAEQRMLQNGRVAELILELPRPVIGAINGPAVGAGCNLALLCDIVIAAESARFGELHASRGFSIDMGGTWILPRLVGLHRAKELAFLADLVLDAAQAHEMGLVNHVVPDSELMETAGEIARRVALSAPVPVHQAKMALNASAQMTFREALAREARAQALCATTEDGREGVRAFVEKRSPTFKGY